MKLKAPARMIALACALLILPFAAVGCTRLIQGSGVSVSFGSADMPDIKACVYTARLKGSSVEGGYLIVGFMIDEKSQLLPAIQNGYRDIYITNGLYQLKCDLYVDSYDVGDGGAVRALIFSGVDRQSLSDSNTLYISYGGANYSGTVGVGLPPVRYDDAAGLPSGSPAQTAAGE